MQNNFTYKAQFSQLTKDVGNTTKISQSRFCDFLLDCQTLLLNFFILLVSDDIISASFPFPLIKITWIASYRFSIGKFCSSQAQAIISDSLYTGYNHNHFRLSVSLMPHRIKKNNNVTEYRSSIIGSYIVFEHKNKQQF